MRDIHDMDATEAGTSAEHHADDHSDDVDEGKEHDGGSSWMHRFQQLKEHLEDLRRERNLSTTDHAPIPQERHLMKWVDRQRRMYKIGRWTSEAETERVQLFESIGGECLSKGFVR